MINSKDRNSNGRFAPGNRGGPGNPYVQRTAALRSALLDTVTEDDVREVVRKLVALAKEGDLTAIRELLDRCLGKSPAALSIDVSANEQPLGTLPLAERHRRLEAIAQRLRLRRAETPDAVHLAIEADSE